MSNRSLFEFNHDYSHRIETSPEEFVAALQAYLRAGDRDTAEVLERFGVRLFGMRHHSEVFDVRWGGWHKVWKDHSL